MTLFEYAITFVIGFAAVVCFGILIGRCIYEGTDEDNKDMK